MRDRVDGQRGRLHALVDVELPVRQLPTRLRERKPNQSGAVVASERIRLRGPVHVAQRRGEAVEVVLRPLVVGDDNLFGGHLGPTLLMFSKDDDEPLQRGLTMPGVTRCLASHPGPPEAPPRTRRFEMAWARPAVVRLERHPAPSVNRTGWDADPCSPVRPPGQPTRTNEWVAEIPASPKPADARGRSPHDGGVSTARRRWAGFRAAE